MHLYIYTVCYTVLYSKYIGKIQFKNQLICVEIEKNCDYCVKIRCDTLILYFNVFIFCLTCHTEIVAKEKVINHLIFIINHIIFNNKIVAYREELSFLL